MPLSCLTSWLFDKLASHSVCISCPKLVIYKLTYQGILFVSAPYHFKNWWHFGNWLLWHKLLDVEWFSGLSCCQGHQTGCPKYCQCFVSVLFTAAKLMFQRCISFSHSSGSKSSSSLAKSAGSFWRYTNTNTLAELSIIMLVWWCWWGIMGDNNDSDIIITGNL